MKYRTYIFFLAVNLIALIVYKYYQIQCEPCLSKLDCPPCISEEQKFIIYVVLLINIIFILYVLNDIFRKKK